MDNAELRGTSRAPEQELRDPVLLAGSAWPLSQGGDTGSNPVGAASWAWPPFGRQAGVRIPAAGSKARLTPTQR